MVEQQLSDICDEAVLQAMGEVPRHAFVETVLEVQAYADRALPIACRQTISQPWIVARMTELLALDGSETVLEVGTGSGYQTAILSRLARRVISLERHRDLARKAERLLSELGVRNVTVLSSDGSLGRSEFGPFQAILVTAAGPEVPEALMAQLAGGGRLVMPVGARDVQTLVRRVKAKAGEEFEEERFESCRFVPLIGRQGWQSSA